MESSRLLDEKLIAKIKGIQIRAKHLVNTSFAGEYKSAFKGRGMEFDEVREYWPGDDIRSIDWNVSARSNAPYVKVFKDERELTVMFVVDVSASSHFGTVDKFKNEITAEIAALLAYTALRNNDKVGLIIFSDHVELYVPPKKGRGHVWRLIKEILTYQSKARKTDINVPLEFLNQVIRSRAVAFLISDFQGDGYQKLLQVTGKHHDLIAISVTDPREATLPSIGYIELEDAETGEHMLVNTNDRKLLGDYAKFSRMDRKEKRDFMHSSGIDFVEIETDKPYVNSIVEFFKKRERRR